MGTVPNENLAENLRVGPKHDIVSDPWRSLTVATDSDSNPVAKRTVRPNLYLWMNNDAAEVVDKQPRSNYDRSRNVDTESEATHAISGKVECVYQGADGVRGTQRPAPKSVDGHRPIRWLNEPAETSVELSVLCPAVRQF